MTTDLHWFKSSHSGNDGECVEIAIARTTPSAIHIRDSKTPVAPTLTVAATAWNAFLPYAGAYSGVARGVDGP